MKITILSTSYPLRGGIAHFVGLLYKELIKKNIVNIITFKRQYPSFLFPGKSQIESGDTTEKIPTEILVDSINPLNWFFIGLKIKKASPDFLIYKYWLPFFAPCFAVISFIAKKNKKTKILVICDNVIPHEKRFGDVLMTKMFFTQVDFFYTLSQKVSDDLISIKPNAKYKLLHHPIYSNFGKRLVKAEARVKLNISENEKVILFFGFIRDYKGLDTLLDALNIINKSENIKLIIAGEFYSNKEKYLEQIEKLNLKEKIFLFNDFIPTDDVKIYFSACDVVLLPYKDATQSGIVQIAMQFKKPMIATNTGGLSEIIKQEITGLIVEKENPKLLADAILYFYKNNLEKVFIANIEKETAEDGGIYSWKYFVDGIFELTNKQEKKK